MLILLAVLLLGPAGFACPMCKDSIPSSDAQQAGSLPGGFNNSIYFVLLSFFTVLGTLCAFIVKTIRQGGARPAFQVVRRPDAQSPKRPA